jgi:hypothetical protein
MPTDVCLCPHPVYNLMRVPCYIFTAAKGISNNSSIGTVSNKKCRKNGAVYLTSSTILDIINQNEANTHPLLYAHLPYLFVSKFPTERCTISRPAPSFMLCGQFRGGGGACGPQEK